MPKLKFSLRALFIAVTVVAIAIGIWRDRTYRQFNAASRLSAMDNVGFRITSDLPFGSMCNPKDWEMQKPKREVIRTFWSERIESVNVELEEIPPDEVREINAVLRSIRVPTVQIRSFGDNQKLKMLCRGLRVDTLGVFSDARFSEVIDAVNGISHVRELWIEGSKADDATMRRPNASDLRALRVSGLTNLMLDDYFAYSPQEILALQEAAPGITVSFSSW